MVSDIGVVLYAFACGADRAKQMALEEIHSSMTSIASSGQFALASQALSSRPSGTEPSPCSCALPYSSRSNSSLASDLQRACPWHLSWSTRTLSFPDIGALPLDQRA